MGDEDREIPLADRQRTPELLFRQRPQNKPDDARRYRNIEIAHEETDNSQEQEKVKVEGGIVEAVNAERGEQENAAIQQGRRNGEKTHPYSHHRKVEHQQHDVADIKAGDQPPHELALAREKQRPGLKTILLESSEHDRRGGGGRQPERQERHQDP